MSSRAPFPLETLLAVYGLNGVSLYPDIFTDSANGETVDTLPNGVGRTFVLCVVYDVLAAPDPSQITVQHSVNGSSWVTAPNGAGPLLVPATRGAYLRVFQGLNRYVRCVTLGSEENSVKISTVFLFN